MNFNYVYWTYFKIFLDLGWQLTKADSFILLHRTKQQMCVCQVSVIGLSLLTKKRHY